MYKKVLFPTDFSPHSQKITECIAEIQGIQEVVLLHVMDASSSSKAGAGPGPGTGPAELLLAEYKKILGNLGLTVQTKVEIIEHSKDQGAVASRILDIAEKRGRFPDYHGCQGKKPS